MAPSTIPIFPLPTVVLFPNVFLPLHIFEPRYRQMVTEALSGDRLIGMTLLRAAATADDAQPAVYPVGCSGVITHVERLADGRFNIILRGVEKFRILDEDDSRAYRLGEVESLPEDAKEEERAGLRKQRQRLEAVLAAAIERAGNGPKFPPAVPDEDLVNALAQYLRLDPLERQALLERPGVLSRCEALIDLLEIKVMSPFGRWDSRAAH